MMNQKNNLPKQSIEGQGRQARLPYESPAIIFTTRITTRAGSPLSIDESGTKGVDPMDLFGE